MILTRPGDAGRLVRQRRVDIGLSQSELADRAGITRQLLSRFEQGKSDLPLATALTVMRELTLSIDVRTREERAGIVEYRIPVIDPTTLARFNAAAIQNLREALAAMSAAVRMPTVDSSALRSTAEAIAAAFSTRETALQTLPTRSRPARPREAEPDAASD